MVLERVSRYDRDAVSTLGDHAVVVGASMAGLLAARVLADAYERVTVLERDDLPDEPVPRRGVPQSHHVHVMLEAGRATLADLFPGYGEDLIDAGALVVDWNSEMVYYEQGDTLATGSRRLPMYVATRPLFELVARRHLTDREGVTVRTGCQVTDYLTDDGASAVTGVECRDDGTERIDADLVVDATGRTSRTPQWLDDHGYPTPPTDEVRVDVAYSSVFVDRPSDDRRAVFAPPSPPRTRGGGAFPVEGDRWLVTVAGVHGDDPPTDREGVVEYAASLPGPDLAGLLRSHEWVSDVDHYPFPASRRRYYETLESFPEGLAIVGDAIASFNPIYGQGMSVAALEALQLHHLLATGRTDDLGPRLFERNADFVDVAWKMAVGNDFQWDETDGPKPRGTDLLNRYITRLVDQAHTDGRLSDAFGRVIMMERSPTSLFRPGVVRRVLLG